MEIEEILQQAYRKKLLIWVITAGILGIAVCLMRPWAEEMYGQYEIRPQLFLTLIVRPLFYIAVGVVGYYGFRLCYIYYRERKWIGFSVAGWLFLSVYVLSLLVYFIGLGRWELPERLSLLCLKIFTLGKRNPLLFSIAVFAALEGRENV